jgi:DNA-binding transcriptional ArsR family regulator
MSASPTRAFKDAAYAHLAEVAKALASPARLEIVELLAQAPRTVEVLAGEIDQSVANTSQHLQALKRAQLVRGERDGLHVRLLASQGPRWRGLVVQLQAVAGEHIAALDEADASLLRRPGRAGCG